MNHFVLMGDVVASSKIPGTIVAGELGEMIRLANHLGADSLLSPLTITLGDEFQGVIRSGIETQKLIFLLERCRLQTTAKIKLRYSQAFGAIDTPVNLEIAHGMIGPALSAARKPLTRKGKHRKHAYVRVGIDYLNDMLEDLYTVSLSISSRWKAADYKLVCEMLSNSNDRMVGELFEMDASEVWKRRKNLRIGEFQAMERSILAMFERWSELRDLE